MTVTRIFGLVLAAFFAGAGGVAAQSVSSAELIKAAKAATVSEVDNSRRECGDDRRIEDWLKEMVAPHAKSIVWSAGACKLAIKDRPHDAGTSGARKR